MSILKPYCNDNDQPQDIPDCYYIKMLGGNVAGEANINQWTYNIPRLELDEAIWLEFLVAWWTAVSTFVLAPMSGQKQVLGFEMRDAKKGGHKAIYTLPVLTTGIIAGSTLPDSDSVAITYSTFEATRGGPGGLRWGPIPLSSVADRNFVTADYRSLLINMMENTRSLTVVGNTAELVKFDRCHGTFENIVSFGVETKIRHLDSRQVGVGVLA